MSNNINNEKARQLFEKLIARAKEERAQKMAEQKIELENSSIMKLIREAQEKNNK